MCRTQSPESVVEVVVQFLECFLVRHLPNLGDLDPTFVLAVGAVEPVAVELGQHLEVVAVLERQLIGVGRLMCDQGHRMSVGKNRKL